jgi:hypothetical protein
MYIALKLLRTTMYNPKFIVSAALSLTLGCNVDSNLNSLKDDTITPDDTDETGVFHTGDLPVEICDGEDNNGDGEIDEGFWDADGDGIKDCVDDDCEVLPATATSELDPDCVGTSTTPPVNPWDWKIEWQWRGGAVFSTPAVGDLDLDGIPEVVFTSAAAGGSLHIFDGATGTEKFSKTGIDQQSGVALGDIDGDGYGDIVASTGSCFTAHNFLAYDRTGTLLWSTTGPTACETYPVIADLEGDGDVEVIVNEYILDGATGSVVNTLDIASGSNWGAPAVADMNGDGFQEIMLENRTYDHTGTLLFSCGRGGVGSFPHPVNVDADPEGELLVAGNGQMTLCDDDGTQLWARSYSSYGSPIAVADFDGDGEQEFAFAKTNTVYLIENDNTVRWTTPITDSSGLAGTTSWDIDLDGVPEVVYADEKDILVLNGATGTVVLRESSHGSVTLAETPAVADVDGDGQGELLYGSNSGGTNGLTIIGSADGDWPFARPVYNQYSYYGANINDDLSVPATPPAPWLAPANLFRGQPSAVFAADSPNLKVRIDDVCVASCTSDGLVKMTGVVWNSGAATVNAGTPYKITGWASGTISDIGTLALTADLAPGGSETFEFQTEKGLAGDELQLHADPEDILGECYEDDNVATYSDWNCP